MVTDEPEAVQRGSPSARKTPLGSSELDASSIAMAQPPLIPGYPDTDSDCWVGGSEGSPLLSDEAVDWIEAVANDEDPTTG